MIAIRALLVSSWKALLLRTNSWRRLGCLGFALKFVPATDGPPLIPWAAFASSRAFRGRAEGSFLQLQTRSMPLDTVSSFLIVPVSPRDSHEILSTMGGGT